MASNRRLDFACNADHDAHPGIFKRNFYHCKQLQFFSDNSKKLSRNLYEFLTVGCLTGRFLDQDPGSRNFTQFLSLRDMD